MRRQPKPENLAKLTPEQKAVFDAWEAEANQSDPIIQRLLDALAINDQESIVALARQLDELIPHCCEHGRSVHLSCAECDKIVKTLFPEDFPPNEPKYDLN